MSGWTGSDIVDGGAGHDNIGGWEGNDTLKGGAGNDTIYGGAGRDQLFGGSGANSFNFFSTDSGDSGQGKADTIRDFNSANGDISISRDPMLLRATHPIPTTVSTAYGGRVWTNLSSGGMRWTMLAIMT